MVRNGVIRIPQFQRAYRWDSTDVLALFDSILRGYPFGSLLLWRKSAPSAELTIGAMRVRANRSSDALWVVDGQQRVTSLVNAVDPEASRDERFALHYSLTKHKFILSRDARPGDAIPLPDLFDLGRAFAWLQSNPDAASFAEEIQRVTGLLRDVIVPASVIAESDETVLREVFDRINAAGRRLRGSEIFDAIHGATESVEGKTISIPHIADRLDATTGFGRLPDQTVYQAILVIRHPDLTRNVRAEFSTERDVDLSFADEDQAAAYTRGEEALTRTIRFLQEIGGVPHSSFVPFRFHVLVLARFFAHFPSPHSRNLELLSRWLWRSTAMAAVLGFTGSTGNIRQLAGLVQPDSESESVQRLIVATRPELAVPVPDPAKFRTNNSTGKMFLGALWSLKPINPATGEPITVSEIAEVVLADTSPKAVFMPVLPRGPARDAANRLISVVDRDEFFGDLSASHLSSHLLDDAMLQAMDAGDPVWLDVRRERLVALVSEFLSVRAGSELDFSPPLSDLDLDEEPDDENGEDSFEDVSHA
ncbi:DUF262 domain-containing protein [Agrococcus sp. SCSIO52902]|nr:DUF262 domain-containing protein [Agrococcus sp. SCSIO52902]